MLSALGVNPRYLFTSVFALGCALAGWGGALQLPREPAHVGLDMVTISDAFVVVVVGGMGSIPGAFIAALVIAEVKALCIAIGTVELGGMSIAFSKTHAGRRVCRDGFGFNGAAMAVNWVSRSHVSV
jgi:branched-chain amino acid transport system permease protein